MSTESGGNAKKSVRHDDSALLSQPSTSSKSQDISASSTMSTESGGNAKKSVRHEDSALLSQPSTSSKSQDISASSTSTESYLLEDSTHSVPDYVSSSQDDSKETQNQRRPKVKKTWEFFCKFDNSLQAVEYVKQEKNWSISTTNWSLEGKKLIYRCNKAKLRGLQCDSGLYLFYANDSDEVSVYKAQNEHTCDREDLKSVYGLTDELKAIIEKLFNVGFVTRKPIQAKLAEQKLKVPNKNKLNALIQKLRRKKFGTSVISIGELEVLLKDRLDIPEDDDEAFVVDYLCSDESDGDFKIFISTKNLLRNAVGSHILSADSTYKMVWEGFPISPIGTTDADCHFHLYGNLISKKEETSDFEFAFNSLKGIVNKLFDHDMAPTILICDAAGAIHNACRNVFGMRVRILMCYFHAKKAIKKNLPRWFKTKSQKDAVLADLDALQLSQDETIFQHASNLFMKKYDNQAEFFTYFNNEWLVANRNWYEGASPKGISAPSTNNALESWNRLHKDEKTLRKRPPLKTFIIQMLQWSREWSEEYTSDAKVFIKEPTITLPVWANAYKWVRLNKPLKKLKNEDGLNFYQIPAEKVQKSDNWSSLSLWNTFDDFKVKSVQGWTTFIQDEHTWRQGSCDCPPFQKTYICKHLLGLAIRFKYVVVPLEARALPLEQKRKRGRPSKAKKALIVQ